MANSAQYDTQADHDCPFIDIKDSFMRFNHSVLYITAFIGCMLTARMLQPIESAHKVTAYTLKLAELPMRLTAPVKTVRLICTVNCVFSISCSTEYIIKNR
jgi:hypothetical protein